MADFDRPTLDTIYQRMKADAEQRFENSNWASKALALILLMAFAGGIYLCYGFLRTMAKQFFFTTANDEYVQWHGRKYGLPRKAAEFATCEAYRFTGVNTTDVPEGTEVQADDGTIFITDALVTIASSIADAALTAAESGTGGNVDTATLTLVTPITDIDDKGTVVTEISGGVDQETLSEHKARLLQRTQNPPGSGNTHDYERWALEISGVGRSWGRDAGDWLGAGTAGVIIGSATLDPVAAATKTLVEANIERNRPIGSSVDVTDILPAQVDLWVSISPEQLHVPSAN